MDKIIEQTIKTTEQTSASEKISVLISLIESQIIDDGIPGLNEARYKSVWDDREIEIIKEKLLGIVKDF